MLKISKTRQFKRTVTVQVPSQTEPDKLDEATFVGVFRAMSRKDVEDFQKISRDKERELAAYERAKKTAEAKGEMFTLENPAESASEEDRAFMRKILVGAEGLADEDGNPLAPADAVDAVIEDLVLCKAAVDAFNANYTTAKEGN